MHGWVIASHVCVRCVAAAFGVSAWPETESLQPRSQRVFTVSPLVSTGSRSPPRCNQNQAVARQRGRDTERVARQLLPGLAGGSHFGSFVFEQQLFQSSLITAK